MSHQEFPKLKDISHSFSPEKKRTKKKKTKFGCLMIRHAYKYLFYHYVTLLKITTHVLIQY